MTSQQTKRIKPTKIRTDDKLYHRYEFTLSGAKVDITGEQIDIYREGERTTAKGEREDASSDANTVFVY